MTTGNKIMWKRGEIAAPKEQFLLFSTIFSVYLYFQESNYIFICEMWLFDLSFFLNSANLIRRNTDISKYFRESLGLRDNESQLYKYGKTKNSNNDGSFTVADSKSVFSKKTIKMLSSKFAESVLKKKKYLKRQAKLHPTTFFFISNSTFQGR